MSQIISIQELENTAGVSEKCHSADSPIFITKNGHSDMVIMSINQYRQSLAKMDVYAQLDEAEVQIADGAVRDASESLANIRKKYRV